MPVAIANKKSERFDLKSCPPDGYVVIRRMKYGEKISRTQMSSAVTARTAKGKNTEIDIDMLLEDTTLWEFANLVSEHNLTDKDDKPLNFKNPEHVRELDPVIGEEISTYIDKLNSFEEDEELKN